MPIVPKKSFTARIVEWDDQKGHGFVEVGEARIFLRRNDFAERHKRPERGDLIRFSVGQDPKGRSYARDAVHVNDGGKLTVGAISLLACLLALPCIALYRRAVDLRWSSAYIVIIGSLTYGCYAVDKGRARRQAWRIPENTLHLLDLLGGWPGGFLAQRRLRHKCSKASYQIMFWLIVGAYQFAALDSLQEWKFSHMALDYITSARVRGF